jgi:site-specific recombinase XerD
MPEELNNQLDMYFGGEFERMNKEEPLFMSLQNKRISVRAVQDLVKKYASVAAPLKKISPHKLRSTFGTNLYRATKDIYIVADVLGHRDVNTTKKHYAAISDDVRKEAASKVKIFEEE